jgi:glycosyltransferase involved in cell wall biosynthesis
VIRVLISDGGRYKCYSGYGDNSRAFALALLEADGFDVQYLKSDSPWEYEGLDREVLESIKVTNHDNDCDVVLQVGTPPSFKKNFKKPSMFFTQCDLSDLSPSSVDAMQGVDAVITACNNGKQVFEKYFPKVYLVPLAINPKVYKPVRRWRCEGPKQFNFIFVGSFSFRKGIDLLIEAFFNEFSWHEANLHLHCPSNKADDLSNFIFDRSRVHSKPPMMSLSTQSLTPAWMNRFYNRADVFVSFTRGEGWGLPIAEAMHCGLPIVAPLSTSMVDYLNEEVAFCLPTSKRLVSEIDSDFGQNFKKSHITPRNSYHEIDFEQAKKMLRHVFENREEAVKVGEKGRIHMLKNFSMRHFSDSLCNAIFDFINY